MRTELRAIQQRVGITFIYITHDQGEALTMSDHVAVMREGVIEQVADGTTIYDDPKTAFVASFVGENNLFRGTVSGVDGGTCVVETNVGPLRARLSGGLAKGDKAFVFIRPESLKYADGDHGFDVVIKARVTQQEFEGNLWQVFLEVAGSSRAVRMSLVNDGGARSHENGAEVQVGCSSSLAVALPEGPLAAE